MLIRATLLSAPALGRLAHVADGGLRVGKDGRIEACGPYAEVQAGGPGCRIVDLRPGWVLPGLVDLHTHLPQYEAVARDGQELIPWLESEIFPAEARFADPAHAAKVARRFIGDLLAAGTTTAVIFGSTHPEATDRIFREAEGAGIRAVVGKTMMDRNTPAELREATAASLRSSEELCMAWHGRDHGRLGYAFAPRFAPSCSPELLKGAGQLARKHEAWIQTHLSENLQELDWVRTLFPAAGSYTGVYRDHGLLGPRTLLGHGIHLAPGERALIREAGASVVHCPGSNTFLKSGIMPLRRWLSEGLAVGLGTDVGAGPSLSLFGEMANACGASKLRWAEQRRLAARLRALEGLDEAGKMRLEQGLDLGPDAPLRPAEALFLATRGGATALGLEDRIGSLEPGREADFIVVDPRHCDPMGAPDPDPERVLARLVYRAAPGMVRSAWVRGKQCFSREA